MLKTNDISFGFSLSALLICAADLMFTLMAGHTRKPQNKIYIIVLSLLSINALCGMVSLSAENYKLLSDAAYRALEVSRYVYFISHFLLAPTIFFYVSYVTGRAINSNNSWRKNGTLKNYILYFVPDLLIVLTELIILLNPMLHWIWTFDANHDFHREWGEFIFVYCESAMWLIASFITVMRSWNILSKNRKYALSFCYFLALLGVMIQLIHGNVQIEVLMEAIGFTGVLLFVENEDERKAVELDVYNTAAFALDVSAAIKNRTPLKIIIVRNISSINTINPAAVNQFDGTGLGGIVADYLASKIERYFIYTIGNGTFALMIYNDKKDKASRTAEEILKRFEQPWNVNGTEVNLSAAVMIVDLPERAKNVKDVFYIAECPVPEGSENTVMKGDSLDWIVRYSEVESAVSRGLSEGSFEVHYQPTYTVGKKLFGAEALIRMHDRELGNIYPDEFIPIAEKLGLIDEIDHFVLKEVCRLIGTGVPAKHGIGHINVNLSVIECMKEGFAEQIISTVETAGIPKESISFEITESVAATDYSYLADVIGKLKNAGFMFYIDDFGTGYSNMNALFSLGADVIKIDKSVLWGAEKGDLGMVLLRGTIKMVKEMHKKTLAEGVETDEQIGLLKDLGCDYLQGYYFSKPLPKSDFLSLICAD